MCNSKRLSIDEKAKHLINLFNQLRSEFGLHQYSFQWNNRKRALGTCDWGKKIICVSKHFLATLDVAILENTIRHEFAHALDAEKRGYSDHGPEWKKWCLVTGCKPNRLATVPQDQKPQTKYVWVCENHGTIACSHRKSSKTSYLCNKCRKPVVQQINNKY